MDGTLPGIVELLLQGANLGNSEDDSNGPKILTLSNMTRGEIYDNSKEGTQGYICFMATLATKLSVKRSKSLVRGWLTLEQYFPRFEPAKVRKLFLEAARGGFKDPKSAKEGYIACLLNPFGDEDCPLTRIENKNSIFGISCSLCKIRTGFGEFDLLIESIEQTDSLEKDINKSLEIANELDAELAI